MCTYILVFHLMFIWSDHVDKFNGDAYCGLYVYNSYSSRKDCEYFLVLGPISRVNSLMTRNIIKRSNTFTHGSVIVKIYLK